MGNSIHPTAIIEPTVVLGDGNHVGPYAVIEGDVRIGDGNWIGPHVTIGTPAQYTTEKFEFNGQRASGVTIGDRCVLREYVTVHQPSTYQTVVEDDCYFMAYCHISHDTVIRRGVNLANNTQIAGFTEIQEKANVGLSVVIHQHSTIGAYAMIGMAAVVNKDIPPFSKAAGNPARLRGINTVGLSRAGFSAELVDRIADAHRRDALNEIEDESVAEIVRRFAARGAFTHRPVLRQR
jgi:UDP-N-acetylglucosamine acyltransferase